MKWLLDLNARIFPVECALKRTGSSMTSVSIDSINDLCPFPQNFPSPQLSSIQANTNGLRFGRCSGQPGENMRTQPQIIGVPKQTIWSPVSILMLLISILCFVLACKTLNESSFRPKYPEVAITLIASGLICLIEVLRQYGTKISVTSEGIVHQTPGAVSWIPYRQVRGVYGLERAANGRAHGFELVFELLSGTEQRINLRHFRNHEMLLAAILNRVQAVRPDVEISSDLEPALRSGLFSMSARPKRIASDKHPPEQQEDQTRVVLGSSRR
jgi:hypothetical protein